MEQFIYNLIKNKTREGKSTPDILDIPLIKKQGFSFEEVDDIVQSFPSAFYPTPKPIYKQGKNTDKDRRVTIRMNDEDVKKLDGLRENEWWSRSFIIREALHDYYKKIEERRKKKLQYRTRKEVYENKVKERDSEKCDGDT